MLGAIYLFINLYDNFMARPSRSLTRPRKIHNIPEWMQKRIQIRQTTLVPLPSHSFFPPSVPGGRQIPPLCLHYCRAKSSQFHHKLSLQLHKSCYNSRGKSTGHVATDATDHEIIIFIPPQWGIKTAHWDLDGYYFKATLKYEVIFLYLLSSLLAYT